MKSIVLSIFSLFVLSWCQAQTGFDVYISNNGSDLNTGNSSSLPKKTINGAFSPPGSFNLPGNPVKIGLQGGDVFNETFRPTFPVQVGTYFGSNKNQFAIFNGTNIFDTGWTRADGRLNIFEQSITLTGFEGIGTVGAYSFIYVFEIDKELEKTAPITARKLLRLVYNMEQADSIPGSFYEPVTVDINPKKIYIHTSDGNTPNQHAKYRYEVTARDRAVNVYFKEGNHFQNLWIRGYGSGNGMIPSGANSTINHIILGPGAGIHHLVLRGGGLVNNTVFFPSARNVTGSALVFYDAEGFGRHNTIANSIFLDIKDPVYTHHSYGSNFGALELNNVFAFADTTDAGGFVQNSNTDSILLRDAYSYQYKYGYNYGWAKYVDVKNSGFIDVLNGISFGNLKTISAINNTFIKTKGTAVNGIVLADSVQLLLANSIIHLRANAANNNNNALAGSFVARTAVSGNHINATGNIFICDVDPSKKVLAGTANTSNGAGTSTDRWKNNVYILLRGDKIFWKVTNPGTNNGSTDILSLEDWKKQSGQDKQSLFFDLRNDPRGLKAIFADPEKGDYELANTIEGNQIKAIRAGMTRPISCFVKKPTYEQAAALIMNYEMLSADVCRNPCVQNNIRGYNQLRLQKISGGKMQVKWNLDDERGVDSYEVLRSFGNNDFVSIQSSQPGGDSVYTFTDSLLQPGIEYRYSIAVVSKTGSKCFSAIQSATTDNDNNTKSYCIYPNPSAGKISLALGNYSGRVKLKICNVMGRVVCIKEFNSLYGISPVIDLSLLPKGMYWAKIETIGTTTTRIQSFLLR
jgi:Secretion system C-terminal sorting domain